MLRLLRVTALAAVVIAASASKPAHVKWPPWLSIESPVNPADASVRDAVCLIHAATHDGTPTLSDLSASAEGLVGSSRKSIALKLDATSKPGVFAVRKQWPSEGTWVLRISLFSTTTAIVALDRAGNVASVRIPTTMAEGRPIPRAVVARDIDSTLMVASAH